MTLRDQGKSMEEVAEWVKNNRLHLVHVFTVDDLYHLYRGGRVSKATAFVGTLAGIKPELHVDNDGHLIVIGKVRGRKKSLHALVDYMEEKMGSYRDQNDIVFISHGDDLPAAELVRDLVKARFGMDSFPSTMWAPPSVLIPAPEHWHCSSWAKRDNTRRKEVILKIEKRLPVSKRKL